MASIDTAGIAFQSTRPIRGATLFLFCSRHSSGISIHAPHTGRDARFRLTHHPHPHFNPRAPYGARQSLMCRHSRRNSFQSTRPIRGATSHIFSDIIGICNFNPRAPYGARRRTHSSMLPCRNDFNPRAPYGARPQQDPVPQDRQTISIHAPHTGRDLRSWPSKRGLS